MSFFDGIDKAEARGTCDTEHRHKCDKCGVIFQHDPREFDHGSHEECSVRHYAAHQCPTCGSEQYQLYLGEDQAVCRNDGVQPDWKPQPLPPKNKDLPPECLNGGHTDAEVTALLATDYVCNMKPKQQRRSLRLLASTEIMVNAEGRAKINAVRAAINEKLKAKGLPALPATPPPVTDEDCEDCYCVPDKYKGDDDTVAEKMATEYVCCFPPTRQKKAMELLAVGALLGSGSKRLSKLVIDKIESKLAAKKLLDKCDVSK